MKITSHGLVRDKSQDGYIPSWDTRPLNKYPAMPGAKNLGIEIAKHDPLLANVPEPYEDPFLRSPSGQAQADEASLLEMNDPLVSPNRPKNWYWLRGRIANGEVEIFVNGRSLGEYSVHVDNEITDSLHPGYNTIKFKPLPDIKSIPVRAHIAVVYSQQETGDAPVLIYDTERVVETEAILPPTHAPTIGGPGFVADPNEAINVAADLGPRVEVMQLLAQ